MSAADMPVSFVGIFGWNGGLKVHCYVCFVDVIQIIHFFKRTSVGAYRIRPSCWRCCMYAANLPVLFEGLFFSAKDVNSLF